MLDVNGAGGHGLKGNAGNLQRRIVGFFGLGFVWGLGKREKISEDFEIGRRNRNDDGEGRRRRTVTSLSEVREQKWRDSVTEAEIKLGWKFCT